MIYGARVREARELRGLTQVQLSEHLGVDPSTIAKIEADQIHEPRPELVAGIANAAGLPVSFFEDPTDIDFPAGSLLFRARASMTKREEAEARAWGALVYGRVAPMMRRLRVPPVTLPRLVDVAPAEAATFTRAALGLSPDRPIPHLVNAAERAGVLVLALPIQLERREAFSAWVGDDALRPVIALLEGAPGDRQRFGVAHELGHLVLHHGRPMRLKQIEHEAGLFAEALLLPEEGLAGDLIPPITLSQLAPLKPKWGVSIQTLVRRSYHLGLITRRQYTYMFEQIGRLGWKMHEPPNLAVKVERPRAVRKMVEVIYGDQPDYRRLAEEMRLFPHQVRQIVEAHADRKDLPPRGAVGEPRVLPLRRPTIVESVDVPRTREDSRQTNGRSSLTLMDARSRSGPSDNGTQRRQGD